VIADANDAVSPPGQQDRDAALTAFEKTEATLRDRCASAEFDAPSFNRKVARCDLSRCRGMCCYDGVYVDENTADVIQKLAIEREADFRNMGLDLPSQILVEDRWCPSSLVTSQKTAVKDYPFASIVSGYPVHFRQTACIFLLDDGRCGLQVLSEWDGRHPWYYKPLLCWLHPIALTPDSITVHDELTDPYLFPWYDGYVVRTFCGRTCPEGTGAADILRDELIFLERILNRNLTDKLGTVTPNGSSTDNE
jgi:hypothetical protein